MQDSPDKSPLRTLLPALAAAAVTFAFFLPSLANGFVNWDDVFNLTGNLHYRGLGWTQLKWMFTTFHLAHYQPLSWASFGLDYLVWGMRPFGYHLTAALLHALNAALFFLVCRRLFVEAGGRGTNAALPALFAALFFSLHPLRAESVAWATERRDVLSGAFYLLAALLYLRRFRPGDAAGAREGGCLPALAAFLAALLSKSMAVTLPAALLILDVYPLRRLPPSPRAWLSPAFRRVLTEKVPFFALSALFAALAYFRSGRDFGDGLKLDPAYLPSAAKALFAYPFYICKTLVPAGLSPVYGYTLGGLSDPRVLAGAAAIAAITAAAALLRRKYPALTAAWLFYLVTLLPASGLLNGAPQAVSDRYSYLPGLALAALAGAALLELLRRFPAPGARRTVLLCAAAILAGLGALSARQQAVWRDSGTLWEYTLRLNPASPLAHNNLGAYLSGKGDHEGARRHIGEALRLKPDYAGAHYNLAAELAGAGEYRPAMGHFREALRLDPGSAAAAGNIAELAELNGDRGGAAAYYALAARLAPRDPAWNYKLAGLLAGQGDLAGAENGYRLALAAGSQQARAGLCAVLAARGALAEAMGHCAAAADLAPGDKTAQYNLAAMLAAAGDKAGAEKHYREALRIDPLFTQARKGLEDLPAGTAVLPR